MEKETSVLTHLIWAGALILLTFVMNYWGVWLPYRRGQRADKRFQEICERVERGDNGHS